MSKTVNPHRLTVALSLLIDACRDGQKEPPAMDLTNWAKQYCTIRLGCSRSSGHTTALIQNLPSLLNYYDYRAAWIDSTEDKRFDDPKDPLHGKVINLSGFDKTRAAEAIKDKGVGVIAVDQAWRLAQRQLDSIYEVTLPELIRVRKGDGEFIPQKPIFYILVG